MDTSRPDLEAAYRTVSAAMESLAQFASWALEPLPAPTAVILLRLFEAHSRVLGLVFTQRVSPQPNGLEQIEREMNAVSLMWEEWREMLGSDAAASVRH